MSADSVVGKINQALYFARLHCDNARALSVPASKDTSKSEASSSARFLRQQQQCYLEASVECLYRAAFFLALQLMDEGELRKQLKQNPEILVASLKAYLQATPSPEINKMLQAFEDSNALGFLLESRRSIWADKNTALASPASEIKLLDLSLSADSCELWMQLIANMLTEFQHSNTEL